MEQVQDKIIVQEGESGFYKCKYQKYAQGWKYR